MRWLMIGLAAVICATSAPKGPTGRVWDGRCERWGSLREALHDGETEGRVSIATVIEHQNVFGVGALAGLEGEVLIEESEAWVSRVVGPDRQETRKLAKDDEAKAALLAVASVPLWEQVAIEKDVPSADVDTFIGAQVKRLGFKPDSPTPVRIVGKFTDVSGHVVNAQCPAALAPGEKPSAPQFSMQSAEIWGRVVGFYAEGQEGVLTHHGSKLHLHLISDAEPRLMVHVDKLGLPAGTVLYLPTRDED